MIQRVLKTFCLGLFGLAIALSAPGAFGQMPQQPDTTTLSASEVSQEQIEKAARIAATVQSSMRAQQMKMMQQEAQKENMDPKMFRRIMRSAQDDSTLKKQLQQAMKAEMKQQRPQGGQNPNQQNR